MKPLMTITLLALALLCVATQIKCQDAGCTDDDKKLDLEDIKKIADFAGCVGNALKDGNKDDMKTTMKNCADRSDLKLQCMMAGLKEIIVNFFGNFEFGNGKGLDKEGLKKFAKGLKEMIKKGGEMIKKAIGNKKGGGKSRGGKKGQDQDSTTEEATD